MKRWLMLAAVGVAVSLGGCAPSGPRDGGTGDPAYVPSGSGGEGSGPTGTGGSEPADNPGAGLPGNDGTGG